MTGARHKTVNSTVCFGKYKQVSKTLMFGVMQNRAKVAARE